MYIKIFVCAGFLAASTMIGFTKARLLEQRVTRLCQWKRCLMLVQGSLRFHRAALWECFEEVSERAQEPFASFFGKVSERLQKKEEGGLYHIWEEQSKELIGTGNFAKEDAPLLELLGESLGHLDLPMQMDQLELVLLQTDENLRQAREQKEQKGKLYQTMGVTVGMLLVLLVI